MGQCRGDVRRNSSRYLDILTLVQMGTKDPSVRPQYVCKDIQILVAGAVVKSPDILMSLHWYECVSKRTHRGTSLCEVAGPCCCGSYRGGVAARDE